MPTQAKRENIDMLAEALKRSDAVFITEYRGLTVKKISAVRKLIRQAGGEMKVCKNTLMRIALKECDMVQASEIDFGPNGYVLSYGDAAAVAKAIRDFSKEKGNEALVIKGAILGGQQLLSKEQVFALADLPSKETLIAQVVGTIAAPLRGLVTVLSGPQRNFVTVLERIKEQKESAA
ncbi:50S ribosomal protein L10 [Cloacibacillus evryensis]|uniref:50S ribosomal protein L10 n=1 Tax=Cloacibacillus evryensis TaxID=508460 RepID=UPI0004BC79F4|nr:50S ribosomal protein L10 [Cloacibacillus evryensis]MCQ4765305.1 50S ribosomal protein L10 [Cloacibacillus evryensis]MEA5034477.1 50S ribosomal protein L10 [Cloacibacillus evryensis]